MARRVGFAFQLMQGEGWKDCSGRKVLQAGYEGSSVLRRRRERGREGGGPEASAPNPSQVSLCRTGSLRTKWEVTGGLNTANIPACDMGTFSKIFLGEH